MNKVIIQQADYVHGIIAILKYIGDKDPVLALDNAVKLYTRGKEHIEFVDMNMVNPWVRVIVTGTENMREYAEFNPDVHHIY